VSNFCKIDYEIADVRHSGVNYTAVTKKRSLVNPHIFVCESYRYSAGQFAYVCIFSIDVRLKVARASLI
jgi:hypothetical protein